MSNRVTADGNTLPAQSQNPSVRTFQIDPGGLGGIAESVNLFRGDVTVPLTLAGPAAALRPRAASPVLALHTARLAALGLVLQTLLPVVALLLGGEDEDRLAVDADDLLVMERRAAGDRAVFRRAHAVVPFTAR